MSRLRILGSARLSNLTDESTSIPRQKAHILGDELMREGELVELVEDSDISADASKYPLFKRPALGPWLNERHHEYDVLMFALADRAIRSQLDLYELSQWALKHRKMIVFVKGPADGPRMVLDFRRGPLDPMTQFLAGVFAFVGEIELGIIKARARDSRAGARKDGRWHGGRPPYGYKAVKKPKGEGWGLEPEPKAVRVIEDIIDEILDGKPAHAVAHELNEKGVLTPSDFYRESQGKPTEGDKWTATTLRNMLRSKTLLGQYVYKKKVVRDGKGAPVMRATPIVSRSSFEAVQAQLASKSINRMRSRVTSPLLGVAFCLGCGSTHYRYNNYDPTRAETYRCSGRVRGSGCDKKPVKAEILSAIVEAQMLQHIGDLEIREAVYIAGESHEDELQEAKEGLADLLQERPKKHDAVRAIYDQQIAALEAQIIRLSALPSTPNRTEYRGTGKTYRDLWASADTPGKRKFLLNAGVRIESAPADGNWVSVGRFERPERYDQAVSLGIHEGIQYAFYLPTDLAERATRQNP